MKVQLFIVCLFFSFCFSEKSEDIGIQCNGKSFTIQDDASLNSAIEQARTTFLNSRPEPISVFDVTLLLPQTQGTETIWKRGTYKPYELGYPAR